MLITRRKVGEALLIGDSIEVVVLEVGQGRVKLGVSAPAEVAVERKEWRLVLNQNRDASGSAASEFVQGMLGAGSLPSAGSARNAATGFGWQPSMETPSLQGISVALHSSSDGGL
ncbi:MAG: carbon storage regulator [Bryobacterales bacterium]|nr:carbon storage regulator [Bryobacterales bacterium]